jgi:hypothetical protein
MRLCSIEGCGKKLKSKGYCSAHHSKYLAYGDPLFDKRRFVEHNGQCKTIRAWAKELNISSVSLSERLRRGWPVHLAVTLPRQKQGGRRLRGVVAQHAQATRQAPPQQGV